MSEPQFTLYSHGPGPNPWKVVIVLRELNLPYKTIYLDTANNEHKRAPYTNLNPNGRMPTLTDNSVSPPFTVWESGAILQYLVERYDTEHKISFEKFEEKVLANQYLMFQMSGQGPYFGQAMWFTHFHGEKIPSAIVRYTNEVRRVLGVLDVVLKDKDYLVGGRVSYSDLSFISWIWLLENLPEVKGWEEEYPRVGAWMARMGERESVKGAHQQRKALMEKK